MSDLVPFSSLAFVNPPVIMPLPSRVQDVSFIPMQDVSDSGCWVKHQSKPLNAIGSGYTSFQEGDVLFAKITPCMENGKGTHAIGLSNGIGFGSTEFHVLRAKHGVSDRYIYHWCNSRDLRQAAEVQMTGSAGQRRVPTDFFSRFSVSQIDIDEQITIATILDTIDNTIRHTEAIIEKLQRVKAGLLHDLLTCGLDENGDLRDPIRHPEQFKDSVLWRIPREWECREIRSCLIENPRNGIYKPANQIGSGTLLVGQTSITSDRIIDVSSARRALVSDQELGHYGIQTDDILVSRVFATLAGVGIPAFVTPLVEPAVFESNMMRLRVDKKVVLPRLLFELLRMPSTRTRIRTAALLSNQASVNQSRFNPIPVIIPKPYEQEHIISCITAQEGEITSSEMELSKLHQLKSGLMRDLLTGTVSVASGIDLG